MLKWIARLLPADSKQFPSSPEFPKSDSCGHKRARHLLSKMPGLDLATTYSHRTCRPTTIGAAAFHFRVRNGTGWFRHAMVTRRGASPSQSECSIKHFRAPKPHHDPSNLPRSVSPNYHSQLIFLSTHRRFLANQNSKPKHNRKPANRKPANRRRQAGVAPRSLTSTWRLMKVGPNPARLDDLLFLMALS